MKYLLVLVVIAIGLWMLNKRLRGPASKAPPPGATPGGPRPPRVPAVMVECAHCGLHLPAADAVPDGAHVYCSEAHRRLGPRVGAP
ncbi:MAG TPA: PP0621 family protein [Aquabacterium sp.]|nr:PP0621 family protein [Aquabacterium sp.]